MGAVNTTYTFTATDTITSTKMNNIIDETVMTADAVLGGSGGSGGLDIASGKLSISANAINSSRLATNSVTSANIVDGTIVNADINASAAIAGTKVAPSFGNQNISTTRTASDFNSLDLINTSGVQVSLNANGNSEGNLRTVTNHPLTLSTNSAERMRITASGNVGVGTSSPIALLHVQGQSVTNSDPELAITGSSGYIHFHNSLPSGSYNGIVSSGDKSIIFSDGTSGTGAFVIAPWQSNTSGIRINSSGNVGICQASPSTALDVNGTVTATAFAGPLTGNASSATTASTVSNSAITAAKLNGNQSGSAPIYGCRAWVSFVGRSTNGDCTIRSSGNINRVARTAEGRYTVYFATSMQDAEYATITGSDANSPHKIAGVISQSAGEVNIAYSQIQTSTSRIDPTWGQVSIFR
jgi:hypothetical protein